MPNPLAMPLAGEITLIRKPHVLRRVGFGNTELYRRVAAGKFPKPVRIGARAVAWNSAEVEKWISDRLAERDAEGV